MGRRVGWSKNQVDRGIIPTWQYRRVKNIQKLYPKSCENGIIVTIELAIFTGTPLCLDKSWQTHLFVRRDSQKHLGLDHVLRTFSHHSQIPQNSTDTHRYPQTSTDCNYSNNRPNESLKIRKVQYIVLQVVDHQIDLYFQAISYIQPRSFTSQVRLDTQDVCNHLGTLHFVHHSTKLVFLSPQGPGANKAWNSSGVTAVGNFICLLMYIYI